LFLNAEHALRLDFSKYENKPTSTLNLLLIPLKLPKVTVNKLKEKQTEEEKQLNEMQEILEISKNNTEKVLIDTLNKRTQKLTAKMKLIRSLQHIGFKPIQVIRIINSLKALEYSSKSECYFEAYKVLNQSLILAKKCLKELNSYREFIHKYGSKKSFIGSINKLESLLVKNPSRWNLVQKLKIIDLNDLETIENYLLSIEKWEGLYTKTLEVVIDKLLKWCYPLAKIVKEIVNSPTYLTPNWIQLAGLLNI
jgi:hypothetical protein